MTDVNCGSCFFGVPVKDQKGMIDFTRRECHAHPPQVTVVAIPTGPASIELRPIPSFPVLGKDNWCGAFMQPADLGKRDS